MEENEAMEGKKLELAMFEQKVLEAIEIAEKQKQDSGAISNGELQFEIQILKEGKNVKIHAFGEEILTLEDGNFKYNIEGLKNIQEKLAENPEFDYKQFGLPDIEYLEELEKQKEEKDVEGKDEEEIGENEKDEEDLSKKKEKEDPEKDETGDKTRELAKKYNVNSSRVTHVSLTREVAGRETLPELDSKTKGYKDVYVIPGKDTYSRIMIGINKDGKEEEIKSDRSRGRIPDINIKLIEEDKITDKIRPYDYWPINNKEGMAVIVDSAGKDTLIYCRQEEGRGKEFQGVIVPEKDKKNIDSNPKEVRDAMDYRQNSAKDLADRADLIKKQQEYEELGAPSAGGKGTQLNEVKNSREQKQLNIQECKKDLMQRDGVSLTEALKRNAMPGYYEKVDADYQRKAEEVYRLVAEEEMPYEEAVRKVKANDREQGGNTPDQNPRKRGRE